LWDVASGLFAKLFRKFPIGLTVSLLLPTMGFALTPTLTPADFFHMGVTNYCQTNYTQARKDVTNGLTLYPNNPWLTNLWELLNRKEQQQQQQQKQQNQDKDKDKDQDQQSKDQQQQQDQQKKDQEKQDQQKKEQQKQEEKKKKEEEQKAADQKKKEDEAKQGQQDGSDQQKPEDQEEKDGEPQAAKIVRMTPQQ